MIDYEQFFEEEIPGNHDSEETPYAKHRTLLEISSLFLNDDLDEIDHSVNASFEIVNSTIGVDRIQVHIFDMSTNCCELSYQFTKENIPEVDSVSVPFDLIEGLLESLKKGKYIFTPNTSELPEGNVKRALIAQKTKSTLIIPMRVRGGDVGFVSFESILYYKEKYDSPTISFLMIYANMLANLMVRSSDRGHLKELIEKISIQNKRHSDFSFIASHNIRSSVANLVAITDCLKTDIPGEFYDMLKVSVDKVNENLISINEILNGEFEAYPGNVESNIRSSVDRVLSIFQTPIENENIAVDNLVDKELNIGAYPRYLDNIFQQIIGNAIKYTGPVDMPQVKIISKKLKRQAQITIIDNGIGFDSIKNAHKLFNVGARFHAQHSNGNGLGLFMAKLQMESIGGKINLKSTPGSGTDVKLVFPLN